MPLSLAPAPTRTATTVTLRGRLDVHRLTEVRTALDRCPDSVRLDLSDVTFLDQSVLDLLGGQRRRRRAAGRELVIDGVSDAVRVILDLAVRADILGAADLAGDVHEMAVAA